MALASQPSQTKNTVIELSEFTFQPSFFFTLVLVLIFKLLYVAETLDLLSFYGIMR